MAPLQAVCTVPLLVGRFCPSSPGGSLSRSPGGRGWCVQGEEASSFPSPLLLGGITSPTPLPPLGPPSTPLPHQQLPTHISLYLALLQISQKYPRSHSPCLGPLVPQAGAAPVGPASWSLLSRPSHPRPSTSLPGAGGKPLRCQPGALQAHLRPRRAQAEVWSPAPPPASLPASPHSLTHSPEALGTETSALVEPGVEGPRPAANTLSWPRCGR